MRHEWKLLGNWDQFSQFTSPPGSERGVLVGLAGHRQNIELDSPFPISEFPDGVYWGPLQVMSHCNMTGLLFMQRSSMNDLKILAFPKSNYVGYLIQGSTYLTNQTEVFARWEAGGSDTVAMESGPVLVMKNS